MNNIRKTIQAELTARNGVINLIPSWVARTLLFPGRRLKLHPKDLYAYGAERGALSERWIASVSRADNGALTVENEGLSYINIGYGAQRLLLKEAMEEAGDLLIGEQTMKEHGGLTAFAKFYDFSAPIPHHVHLMEQDARQIGVAPKPEAYYFAPQLNSITYYHDYTFFGLLPGVTKKDVVKALENWGKYGDNGILELSVAYKLKLGTGWNVPAGILHAPGSLVTYEPQRVSDTSMFMQSMVHGKYMERELLTKFIPQKYEWDFEYMAEKLDWEANQDLHFKENHYCEPIPVEDMEVMRAKGYEEKWVCYGSDEFCAKELTVFPGAEVTITDSAAYGLIMLEGNGKLNGNRIETPAMIRFGELTNDEMFVTAAAARAGVVIKNESDVNPLVMCKNFSADNVESKQFVK
ncbi:hypothetical protein CE91St36_24810 [Christensenellaceae bacterium]|nr:hypothetical protein CE91St36_24810 [Christensenellaceae bacterium]BDF62327.1 hypothetical protein CE91St37_24770 [Christensenellaceae bacterium]